MPLFDLIIAGIWLGGLTVYLLGQAVFGWLRLRYARRCARQASRLSEATQRIARERSTAATIPEMLPRRAIPAKTPEHRP